MTLSHACEYPRGAQADLLGPARPSSAGHRCVIASCTCRCHGGPDDEPDARAKPRPKRTLWTRRCEECHSLFEADHRDRRFHNATCQKRHRRAALKAEAVRQKSQGYAIPSEPSIGGPTPANTVAVDPVSRTPRPFSRFGGS